MLITLFIGNGFDLNNGLQTTFTDFYNHIKSTKSEYDIRKNDIYSCIEKDRDKWSYFEMQLGQLTFKYSEEQKNKLLEDIDEFREDFIDYMTDQNELFSFEKEPSKQALVKTITEYMSQLEAVEREDILSIYNSTPSNRMFNFINFNYTNTLEQVVNLIDKRGSLLTSSVKNSNYGNYLGEIIPIHKQLETGMFLGVNDESQMNSEIFSPTEKMSLIKPEANDGFREDTNKKVENIIQKSSMVIIYGMSLGETDKKWWVYLGRWLKEGQNNRLIIYVHDSKFSKKSPRHYFDKRTEYEDRFLGFSYDLSDVTNAELMEEMDNLRKKIYLIPNSKTDFKFSSSVMNTAELTK